MNIQTISYGLLIVYWMIHLIKMISNFSNKSKYNLIPLGKNKQVYIEAAMKLTYLVVTIYQLFIFYIHDVPFIMIDWIWLVLASVSIGCFALCMIEMNTNWHAGIKESKADSLVTTGIYKYSRNPAFVSLYLLYLSIALLQKDILLFGVTVCLIFMIHQQILQEEIFLNKNFKEEYSFYCQKTRRYL